jgi:hypothetical protein
MEDKEIADAGAGCLGFLVFILSFIVGLPLILYVNVWLGLIVGGIIFVAGLFMIAQKRYPR